ncbi:MAG: thioredoxin [Myxococcales bacterium]|nr:thioredoxin [Myxococcales bacterium]
MGLLSFLRGAPKQPPLSLTDANFEAEVAKSDLPVIIDIWSMGCAPCKHLEPVFMELAGTYAGRVKVCELGTHSAPRATSQLQVRGTPTVAFVRGGKVLETVVGVRSSLYYAEAIEELFGVPKKPVE